MEADRGISLGGRFGRGLEESVMMGNRKRD